MGEYEQLRKLLMDGFLVGAYGMIMQVCAVNPENIQLMSGLLEANFKVSTESKMMEMVKQAPSNVLLKVIKVRRFNQE